MGVDDAPGSPGVAAAKSNTNGAQKPQVLSGASLRVAVQAARAGEYVVVPAAGAGVDVVVQAAGAGMDDDVPAAGAFVTGLVGDDTTFSAPAPTRRTARTCRAAEPPGPVGPESWSLPCRPPEETGTMMCRPPQTASPVRWPTTLRFPPLVLTRTSNALLGAATPPGPCRAQFLVIVMDVADTRRKVAVQAAGASPDVVVQAAGGTGTGLVVDKETCSAPGSDAQKQDDALGGEAAWPCRAQVLVVAVQAAGAGVDAVAQATGASLTVLAADRATPSAAGADAQNQHDAEGGEAARPCRAQPLDVTVRAAGASADVGVQTAGAHIDGPSAGRSPIAGAPAHRLKMAPKAQGSKRKEGEEFAEASR